MNAPATPQPRDPGVYVDVPIEDYHAEPGVSSTMLRMLQHCPREVWAHYINPRRPPHRQKPGQLEGQLAHCAVLEPMEFDRRYAVLPVDAPRRPSARQQNAARPSWGTLEDCKWWDRWDAALSGRVTITAEQRATAMAQAEAVHSCPEAAELLEAGTPEVAAYWVDEASGHLCKCRPDWERPSPHGVALPDLKTFASAHPDAVRVQIERKGYWLQAAWYTDGFEAAGGGRVLLMPFIFVEDHYPFNVSVHYVDDDGLAAGRARCRELLDLYAKCSAANDWPAFPGVRRVTLSRRLLSE